MADTLVGLWDLNLPDDLGLVESRVHLRLYVNP